MNIYWLLCGGKLVPSARIHGINIHKELKKLNYSSFLAHVPSHYTEDLVWSDSIIRNFVKMLDNNDIVILQKLNGIKTVSLAFELNKKGCSLIFIDCDLPIKNSIAKLSNIIIVPSSKLAEEYLNQGFNDLCVIQDAIEIFKKPERIRNFSKSIVWFGKSGSGKWDVIQNFKNNILPILSNKWQLVTISDHFNSDFRWDINTYYKLVFQSDLAVIPISGTDKELVKSANRCTQAMALGVPVMANYLQSYKEVITNFENGLVSNDLNEWRLFLEMCENDEFLYNLKKRAYQDSLKFSIENVIKYWIEVLNLPKTGNSSGLKFIFLRIKMFLYLYK